MDVQPLASGIKEEHRAAVLAKLNAAKSGGFIFQSDHPVSRKVFPENDDYVAQLVRRHGVYPLHLEEFDLPEIR